MDQSAETSQSRIVSKKIIQAPSLETVLSRQVSFPFEMYEMWIEEFNHMRVVKGEEVQVLKEEDENGKKYTLTLPERPTLSEIIEAVKIFSQEAGIEIKDKQFEDFTRAIRNTARLILKYTPEEKKEKIQPLIDSIYALGSELHQAFFNSTPPSLENHPEYELPQESDKEAYENDLFLRLLGKGSIYFDPQDEKLSQVIEHSAYYSLFERFRQRQTKKDPDFQKKSYKEQIELFNQWLIKRKKVLINSLLPYFYEVQKESQDEQTGEMKKVILLSSLQEGGRTHYALMENITRQVLQFLDEAVEEEGGKKAKEPLTSPPLFIDLGEDLQRMLGDDLRELQAILDQVAPANIIDRLIGRFMRKPLIFNQSRFQKKDTLSLINQLKQQVGETRYGQMSLFKLANEVLKNAQLKKQGESLTTYEKLTYLLDLVQAYEPAETYKLTTAVETKAFECNLRSYILGKLCQEFLKDEIDVYVVFPTNHTRLMIVDKSKKPQKAYWVDPTRSRYRYDEGIRKKFLGEELAIEPLQDDDWLTIQKGIQANPDHFSLFGKYQMFDRKEFATILPFEGIKSGFWNNLGVIKHKEADQLSPNTEKRRQLIQQVFFCRKKALELDPNNPDYHNNLALLYTDKDFAYDEKGEFDIDKYISNINQAFLEMYEAYQLNPTINRIDKFLLVLTLVSDEDAEAVYQGLSFETKELIWEMYQTYQENRHLFTRESLGREPFSLGCGKSRLFELIQEEF